MNFFPFLIAFVSPLPLLAYVFRKSDLSKYVSLLPLTISTLTIFHLISCRVSTLLEWYWINCALTPTERLILASSLPQFYVPLIASILTYPRKLVPSVSASLLLVSLLLYWSNYLNLNSSMMFNAPSIQPIGYGTIRSTLDVLYLPLFHLSVAFFLSYLISRRDFLGNASVSTALLSLALFEYYNLTTYGIPIPYSVFHIAYLVAIASLLLHYIYRDKVSSLSFILASLIVVSIARLVPMDAVSPYFSDQRSIGIALGLSVLSSLYYLKGLRGLEPISVGVLIPSLVALSAAFVPQHRLEAYQLSVVLVTLTLSIAYYKKCKYVFVAPIGVFHYVLASLMPIASFLIMYLKRRSVIESIKVALVVALALSTFYSSSAPIYFGFIKQANVTHTEVLTVSTRADQLNGQPRILNREVLVNFVTNSTDLGNVSLRVKYRVPIYMGKYLPPGYEKSFAKGVPIFNYVGSCAIALREEGSAGLYSNPLRCYPLTLCSLISAVALSLLFLFESLYRRSK